MRVCLFLQNNKEKNRKLSYSLTHSNRNCLTLWLILTEIVLLCDLQIPLLMCAVVCLVTQLCLTLCNPMNCSLPGSSVNEDSPGKNTGVSCHALLQGIVPTQRLNPVLPHCRWILYLLSHQGSQAKGKTKVEKYVMLLPWLPEKEIPYTLLLLTFRMKKTTTMNLYELSVFESHAERKKHFLP